MKDMKFSVQEVDLTDEDPDFADAELWFLSDGNNAQNSPISTEVLKRDAGTFIGKPIVAKYDKWTQDVTSHVPDEVIVGWIPADSTIDFKEKDGTFQGSDVREGLVCVISIKIPEPQFEGQTKTKLGNSEVTGIVSTIVGNNLKIYLEDYPKEADRIIEKMI